VAERSKPPPKNGDVASPALKVASETLLSAAKRDYALIRNQLTKVSQLTIRESDPGLDSLVQEARTHCWVQWEKDGTWVDLDPSFADATLG
jgi:hypothetical protein